MSNSEITDQRLSTSDEDLTLDLPSFLRLFQRRGRSIMWPLGAGASRAAGIKTGWDMIWDFKRSIYRSQKGVRDSALPDNTDLRARRHIQHYFDGTGDYPPSDDPSEYAAYFEAAYHAEGDRRRYIEEAVSAARPTHGHRVLVALMAKNLCDIVWTTNFDRLVEDAAATKFGTTGRLAAADLNNPSTVVDAISESRWPVYGKLHGDFQSRSLKNTASELQSQDETLRQALVDACRTRGLAVVGYSGRDESVMEALAHAVDEGGLPQGLYWFHRGDGEAFPAVRALIQRARAKGIDAHLVDAQGFDEAMSEIATFLPELDGVVATFRTERAGRRAAIQTGKRGTKFPVIRTNGFPVTAYPQIARLIGCEIGNSKEVREVLEASGRKGVATRIRDGIIAFGDDDDLRTAYSDNDITEWNTHPILDSRLIRESGERRLLRDALFTAISEASGLELKYRRSETLAVADPNVTPAHRFRGLGNPNAVKGVVDGTCIEWVEVCGLRLDYRDDRLWLLLDPRTHIVWIDDTGPEERNKAKDFVRERMARRYNSQSNDLLESWRTILLGADKGDATLTVGPFTNGIGASFTINTVSGFSGRTQ